MTNSFKTYYVSQIDGNDTNDGLSKSSAFATLFAINRLTLQPGDRVLLAKGSVFEGQFLQIKDSGTKESPIEIGAYLPESAGYRSKRAGNLVSGLWHRIRFTNTCVSGICVICSVAVRCRIYLDS